jgi:peptidoglycan/LPS O-acetylase OafA/YrhL
VLISTVVDYGYSFTVNKEVTIIHPRYDVAFEDSTDRTELLSNVHIQENQCSGFKHKVLNICRVFSFFTNGKKLFGTETAVGPLASLNGIRVLSMWWVILGHTYFFAVFNIDNVLEASKLTQRFSFQPIVNGSFSVDSFFFLSGLLVAYLSFKQIKEKGTLNWPYYFLHRYWRLTPLYLSVILYYAFISPYTITGPNSYSVYQPASQNSYEVCKKYWWTNLLYINNFYPNYGNIQKTCIGWSWYLANDMQFYLFLGPIFIISFGLRGKLKYFGFIFIAAIFLAGVVVRGILVWYFGIYSLAGQATKHIDNPWSQNNPIYDKPYARWSVYLIGMVTGYVLASTNNKIRLKKGVVAIGWCVAIATGLAVVYGMYHYNHTAGTHMTLFQSVCYITLSRPAWGLCLCWVVLACVSGNGGPVSDILSWKIWAPLGRLTYAAYLVHPLIMMTYNFNALQPLHFSDLFMVYLFIANLVVSYIVAFIVSMLIEAPMIQLEKLLLAPLSTFGRRFVIGPLCRLGSRLKAMVPVRTRNM